MWDVKGALIQVEIGAGLVHRYSSKGFFGTRNNDGKLLLDVYTDVREKLRAENIVVPQIQCRDDNSLGKDEFTVYVGSEFYSTNIRENEIADVIEFLVRRVQVKFASKDSIHKHILAANEHLSHQRYMDGLKCLSTAYYWSNFLEGCEEEAADTILQIGRILIQNNDVYHAELCAQRAAFISSQSSFYNPYLKCAADEFAGFLYMIKGDLPAADRAYTSAFNKIANVPEANLLKIGVLAAELQTLLSCKNYVKANQAAQILLDVLDQSGCTDLTPIYEMKSYIDNCAIEQQSRETARLRMEARMVDAKYNEAMNKLRFREQLKGTILVLLELGVRLLPVLSGSLTSSAASQKPCTRMVNITVGNFNQISI